ncbi:CHAT domain-containing protein/tetratricopeptide (TPR) repeat protein [Allocatelliglobosispora scoriae]|uniref:CHAT domain-containing protein/tetratricopeptide (TPR) repeat protein n=1 Tax=Allocatelliglobosispora scoriae TaxID=643052 RepID=A0A841BIP6_9ACTN|nr:CHAT domain-containing protein [Allocatelliglobosispora scoriae]MBB5866652.1 CHAT domain-containing protein/tetratricopeptide (TPR) repeat protein [Allocatelliglobosispora scoriae]
MDLESLTWRARAWVHRHHTTGNSADVLGEEPSEDAAALWAAVRAVDLDHPGARLDAQFAAATLALSQLHYHRYLLTSGHRSDVELARTLLSLQPESSQLHNIPLGLQPLLGKECDDDERAETALRLLHASTVDEDPALLDAAILLMTPPPRGQLTHLCQALRRRFELHRSFDDLAEAITAGQAAVAIPDEYDRDTEPWSHLAAAYRWRYRLRGDPADLRRVINLLRRTLAATGPTVTVLADLGAAYRLYHDHTGIPGYADSAVDLGRQAVRLAGDRADAAIVSELCASLLRRYERVGHSSDLADATTLTDRITADSTDTPADDGAAGRLAVAARVLLRHAEHSRSRSDLDRAASLARLAQRALRPGNHQRPGVLGCLAAALHDQYLNTADANQLAEAVKWAEAAVVAAPAGHFERDRALSELVGIRLTQFTHTGALTALTDAIEHSQRAVAGPAEPSPQWLAHLGYAYQQRYSVTGDRQDLDRAVRHGAAAVAATGAGDTALAGRQASLAAAYSLRHTVAGDRCDLDRSIELIDDAVAGTRNGQRVLPELLSSRAAVLLARHRLDGDPADVEAAVADAEGALATVPHDHGARLRTVTALCDVYRERLIAGPAPDPTRLAALAAEVTDTRSAAPSDRVAAHHALGLLAGAAGNAPLAAAMLTRAAEVLHSVAPRETGWTDQQHRLGRHAGLVGAGVAAHCAAGDPAAAVEFAELGRGVLLASQANTRVDPTRLEIDQILAEKFRWACERLNTPHFAAQDRQRWWADHDRLLAEIRRQPGQSDFLAAPSLDRLRVAVEGGYGVLLNVSGDRGEAVVVHSDREPTMIALPDLHESDVEAMVRELLAAAENQLKPAGVLPMRQTVTRLLGRLWDTAVGPVVASLPDAGDAPHRVWWVPTGLLGLLPLHAAGHLRHVGALDALISSYVPSLRVLHHSRSRPAADQRRRLSVALRRTPGQAELSRTAEEAPSSDGATLADGDATADRVVAGLRQATWVHFACHAVAEPSSPADGGLLMHDRTLRLPEIGGLRLAEAELAYLSACSTAHYGTRHADEVLHLASAFQLAGFRHVVASLWPLRDSIAATAAAAFYEELPAGPGADGAAVALREVTLRLRAENPARPELWAPLIHSGP